MSKSTIKKLSPAESELNEIVAGSAYPEQSEQSIHDSRVEDAMLPGFEDTLSMAGIDLEHMSLTTMTWLRRAGSCFVTGVNTSEEGVIVRDTGMFLLAHNKRIPFKDRSRLFRKAGDELEDAIDELLHRVRISDASPLFKALAEYVRTETATLATPEKEDGDNEMGNG